VAVEKAAEGARRRPGALVLAADTAVVLGSTILGKPSGEAEAREMVRALSGRRHSVLTGVALDGAAPGVGGGGDRGVVPALSEAEIAWYASTGEPLDKAGAYAIQAPVGCWCSGSRGARSNVWACRWRRRWSCSGRRAWRCRGAGDDAWRRASPRCARGSPPPAPAPGAIPAGVELIAVSKLQPEALIEQAHQAGHRAFGENYAQELRDKSQHLAALAGIRWHFIGPLQANKAKYVARAAHVFHAVDRLEIAAELSRRREGTPLEVLVQVWSGEQTKSGVSREEAPALVERLRALPRLKITGLMAMPPLAEDPEQVRPHFRALRELADALGLLQRSMGTTADFEVAIEEGATMVRVGTGHLRRPRAPLAARSPSASAAPPRTPSPGTPAA